MSQRDLSLGMDDPTDDLPRTLRREKEARAAQAAAAQTAQQPTFSQVDYGYSSSFASQPQPAVMKALDIPFLHLMFFFIKAVLAAIPALILLGALLWLAGDILMAYFPWLVHVKVQIYVPNA
ncbi:MAG: hypothetical protein RLZ98_1726 [Pseudomonadota bacterium]|jgi:hypothetical protein